MDTKERDKITKKVVNEIMTYLEEETDFGIQFEEMEDYEEKEMRQKMENIIRHNLIVTVKK